MFKATESLRESYFAKDGKVLVFVLYEVLQQINFFKWKGNVLIKKLEMQERGGHGTRARAEKIENMVGLSSKQENTNKNKDETSFSTYQIGRG